MRLLLLTFFPLLALVALAPAAGALDWQPAAGGRVAELAARPNGKAGFTSLSGRETGVAFTNLLTEERGITNQIYMSGAGVACGDVDGDGWCDVYFCGLDSPNALYRNLGGWKFQDVTASAGVTCADQASTGAVFADVDGDGDLDLLVNALGRGTRLFLNNGRGGFREDTMAAGLASRSAAMSLALADVDGDGDLDLYVANYRSSTFQDAPALRFRVSVTNGVRAISMIDGRPVTPEEAVRFAVNPRGNTILENGEADVLWLNDGRGRFTAASWTDGTFRDEAGLPLSAPPYDWSYSVMFRDMNGDGSPDIYVCGDSDSPDRIWLNDGGRRFRAMSAHALRQTSFSSMGVDFADLNRDGFDEFFVADMLSRERTLRHRLMVDRSPPSPVGLGGERVAVPRNTLFLNRGDGTYAEMAQFAGVEASDWSWCPVFLDVDLDGYEDLLITTGLERSLRDADARQRIEVIKARQKLSTREFQELRKSMPRLDTPNYAFRNRGDLTFEMAGDAWGFNSRLVSQGMALADLDNDGDLDVVINVLNGPALAYRNDASAPRVGVRLKGAGGNTRGIGAKIKFLGGAVPLQSQEMIAGGRYLSGDDAMRVFAPGKATNALSIEVTWRSGGRSVLSDLKPDSVYEVTEAKSTSALGSPKPAARPFFKEVSEILSHVHHEEPFNDFQRQPLLPRRFSQLGPGVSWCDFNGDGRDDLIIGAGRGGELGVFMNNGQGGFERISVLDLTGKLGGDAATVLNVPSSAGSTLLLAVSNYETGSTNESSVLRFDISAQTVQPGEALPGQESSAGPMALADVDGDGELDLFVGGRVVPGRYPEPASSRLWRGVGGQFRLEEDASKLFANVGLVSGAVFSDLDGDGFPELILACEWAAVRVFRNVRGKFTEATNLPGLAKFTGWWNSVTTGDFDGDGRMDIVAGNWGRNCKHQFYVTKPLRILYGDWLDDGGVQMLEAFDDPASGKVLPWRHREALMQAMPWLEERFPTATTYSMAGIADIVGERRAAMKELSAATLDSMVFLNRGDHFEARSLPMEAQLAPVFGVNVADFDGDGKVDIFLCQNFFDVDAETSRHDAGRGLWLKGDGRGEFAAVSGLQSGVVLHGQQRGSALGDYDGDGRIDLAVAQNGAATKLYHNEGARAGLRVRLKGAAGNLAGIGAVVRFAFGARLGPAHEIHAGSGYWSQDAAVIVMATPESPSRVLVRWPGGKTVQADVPAGAREIGIGFNGRITRLR